MAAARPGGMADDVAAARGEGGEALRLGPVHLFTDTTLLHLRNQAPPIRRGQALGFFDDLATDSQDLSRPYRTKSCQDIRNEREQVAESVTASGQNDHAKRQHTDLLLIDQVAVDRYEDISVACCDTEKLAVLLSRPSGLGYGLHLMVAKVLLQSTRKALVKQYAHIELPLRRPHQARRRFVPG